MRDERLIKNSLGFGCAAAFTVGALSLDKELGHLAGFGVFFTMDMSDSQPKSREDSPITFMESLQMIPPSVIVRVLMLGAAIFVTGLMMNWALTPLVAANPTWLMFGAASVAHFFVPAAVYVMLIARGFLFK